MNDVARENTPFPPDLEPVLAPAIDRGLTGDGVSKCWGNHQQNCQTVKVANRGP